MTRLIAILVALLFALGAVSVPMANAGGTTTKAPTKSDSPEARGGAGKPMKKQLDINSASDAVEEDQRQPPLQAEGRAGLQEGAAARDVREDQGPDRRQAGHGGDQKIVRDSGGAEHHSAPSRTLSR